MLVPISMLQRASMMTMMPVSDSVVVDDDCDNDDDACDGVVVMIEAGCDLETG